LFKNHSTLSDLRETINTKQQYMTEQVRTFQINLPTKVTTLSPIVESSWALARAQDLHNAMTGWSDRDKVFAILDSCSQKQLLAIEQQFDQNFGKHWGGRLRGAFQRDLVDIDCARAWKYLEWAHAGSKERGDQFLRDRVDRAIHFAKTNDQRTWIEGLLESSLDDLDLSAATPLQKAQLIQVLLEGIDTSDEYRMVIKILDSCPLKDGPALLNCLENLDVLGDLLAIRGKAVDSILRRISEFIISPDAVTTIFVLLSKDGLSNRDMKIFDAILTKLKAWDPALIKLAISTVSKKSHIDKELRIRFINAFRQ